MKKIFLFFTLFILFLQIDHKVYAQTTNNSPQDARALLDAGIKAAGGLEFGKQVENISFSGAGKEYWNGQGESPSNSVRYRTFTLNWTTDFQKNRFVNEFRRYDGKVLDWCNNTIFGADSGKFYDCLANELLQRPAPPVAARASWLRQFPQALFQRALGRANTLRWVGVENVEGKPQNVIGFIEANNAETLLYLDAKTNLLTKAAQKSDSLALGAVMIEQLYSDYRPVENLVLPYRFVLKNPSDSTRDVTITAVNVNAKPDENSFTVSAGAEQGKAGSGQLSVSKISDNVYFAKDVVNSYNSMFVLFKDYVLVVEAPGNDKASAAVIAKIKEIAPDKPVKYVVMTHFHFDHAGGIKEYMKQGATIVASKGNRDFLEKVASVPHPTDSPAQNNIVPNIETVAKKRVFTDSSEQVELYEIGRNPHVDEMLIAYLPKEKIVFVADLFGKEPGGTIRPANAETDFFVRKINRLGLQIETIAPGHEELAAIGDLQKAVKLKEAKK